MIVAGAYITWFWIDDLSSDAGEQSEAVGVIERWSATLTNWIDDHSGMVGLVLGGLVAVAVLATVLKRFEPNDDETPSSPGDRTTAIRHGDAR